MTLPLKVFVHLVPFSIRETYTLPELLSKRVSYISSQPQGVSIPKPTESLNKLTIPLNNCLEAPALILHAAIDSCSDRTDLDIVRQDLV